MSNAQAYIQKCLELSERATSGKWHSAYHNRTESWAITYEAPGLDAVNYNENVLLQAPDGSCSHSDNTDFVAHAKEALPKVCEALKIAVNKLEHILETEEAIGDTLRTVLTDDCYEALDKINKLFDDADGG